MKTAKSGLSHLDSSVRALVLAVSSSSPRSGARGSAGKEVSLTASDGLCGACRRKRHALHFSKKSKKSENSLLLRVLCRDAPPTSPKIELSVCCWLFLVMSFVLFATGSPGCPKPYLFGPARKCAMFTFSTLRTFPTVNIS